MTSGIYLLTFANKDTYVGQAKDIQKRWQQHFNDLKKNKHTKALQTAFHFSNYQLPEAAILLECHEHYLDLYESYFINDLKPTLNHQIPKALDEYTLRWMLTLANSDCAKHSIPNLIEEVYTGNEAKREVGKLRDSLGNKVAIEALAIEGHEKALEQLEKLRWIKQKLMKEVGELEGLVAELKSWRFRVEKASWWDRLWKTW